MSLFSLKPKLVTVPRQDHCVSRANIDPDALKILFRLTSLGHEAYLVGGSVRDLLLHREPKDFDIGTDARPNEIRRAFRNCFLVGKRFRLAHIVYGKKVFETATFRRQPDPSEQVQDEHGLYQFADNTYGSPKEDALRRDFTVNGLFYNIKDRSVIDYVGGLKDLEKRTIRTIGDPCIRFREDPVRMMRAVRFAAKLDFTICRADLRAIKKFAHEISNASTSRLCEEIMRLFVTGASTVSFNLAYDYNLLKALLPSLSDFLDSKANRQATWDALSILDQTEGEHTNGVKFAMLYYPLYRAQLAQTPRNDNRRVMHDVATAVFAPVVTKYKLPRTVWMTAVDLFEFLPRFKERPNPKTARCFKFCTYGAFNEALDFAEMVAKLEGDTSYQIDAWRTIAKEVQEKAFTRVDRENPDQTVVRLPPNPHSRQARRRPTRRRRKPAADGASAPAVETPPSA